MKSMVEIIFKNLNLIFVQAFGRTGGEHHPVLPQNRKVPDQIVGFRSLFFNPLHHTTHLHPTVPFPHLGPAKDLSKPTLIIDDQGARLLSPCRHVAPMEETTPPA